MKSRTAAAWAIGLLCCQITFAAGEVPPAQDTGTAAPTARAQEEDGDKRVLGGAVRLFQNYIQYQGAVATRHGNLAMNRVQYGVAVESTYPGDVLVRAEGRANLMFGGDHQARARDKSLAYRGEVRDLFAQKNFGEATVKLGRQYVNWSEMEALGFLGDVNPRDFNEFAFQSITDSSFTETRIALEHYGSKGRLTAFYTPKARSHIAAHPGSKYDLEAAIFDPAVFSINEPRRRQHELGARYLISTERADIGLIAARLVSNDPVYTVESAPGRVNLRRSIEPYDLFAVSANRSFGRWTFRTETGYERGRSFQAANAIFPTDSALRRRNQVNLVLSGEYMDLSNALYHVEYSERRIRHWSEDIGRHKNKREFFFLYRSSFLRNLLDVEYTYYREINDKLGIHRGKFSYDIDDKTRAIFQIDHFRIPSPSVLPLKDLDRASLFISYLF